MIRDEDLQNKRQHDKRGRHHIPADPPDKFGDLSHGRDIRRDIENVRGQ